MIIINTEIIVKFVNYLLNEVKNGSIYVLGGQGERGSNITQSFIKNREHDDTNNINRVNKLLNKRKNNPLYDNEKIGAFDCSGLICYFLLSYNLIPDDRTANGLKGLTKQIKRNEIIAGDFCCQLDSKGKCTHIAVAIDNINCVEARGRDYGVVISEIDDRQFTYFGRFFS